MTSVCSCDYYREEIDGVDGNTSDVKLFKYKKK